MKYRTLGRTNLNVSALALGTVELGMDYGIKVVGDYGQPSRTDAINLVHAALDRGINFIDTAEMYAVPFTQETQGLTEKYIGTWLAKTGNRDKIVLATKITGPGRGIFKDIRPHLNFSKESLDDALHKSLIWECPPVSTKICKQR